MSEKNISQVSYGLQNIKIEAYGLHSNWDPTNHHGCYNMQVSERYSRFTNMFGGINLLTKNNYATTNPSKPIFLEIETDY